MTMTVTVATPATLRRRVDIPAPDPRSVCVDVGDPCMRLSLSRE